jgi:hypothetical protein
VQLRKTIKNFQDVEYNFKLIDRLLKGHGLDGEHIREVPALKISGRLDANQITVGSGTLFEQGYDIESVSSQMDMKIRELRDSLGDMAFEDQVELAKLGSTIVQGGYLQTIKINAASITAGTISSDRIASGSITADKIKARSIDTDKITVGGVTSTNLANNSVITVKLADNAVTGAKIAAEAVTASKIAAGAVTAAKIAAGAVTAAKIAAGAITADKLAANIILTGTLWAGANRVKLDSRGITVYGESLRFYDGDTNAGGVVAIGSSLGIATAGDLVLSASSDKSISFGLEGIELMITKSGITLNQGLRAIGLYTNRLYDILPFNTTTWLGTSNNKFSRGYFTQLPGCPMPTSNSGVRVLKKINNPKVMDGKHGTRHYFLDEDFPSEMKCKVATKTADGRVVETEEEEIEYIRTIGVLVQATREIISRIETLEKEVLGHAKDPEDY